jgi:mevalonate pyrophosphate decarboxylase
LQWCDPACGCCLQGSPDLKAAKEVADYLKTKHHEFTFTVQVQNSWADQWVILSSSSSTAAAAADSAQAQPEVLCKVDWSSRMNSSQVYTYDDGSSFEH